MRSRWGHVADPKIPPAHLLTDARNLRFAVAPLAQSSTPLPGGRKFPDGEPGAKTLLCPAPARREMTLAGWMLVAGRSDCTRGHRRLSTGASRQGHRPRSPRRRLLSYRTRAVTGTTGYAGGHIVRELPPRGHATSPSPHACSRPADPFTTRPSSVRSPRARIRSSSPCVRRHPRTAGRSSTHFHFSKRSRALGCTPERCGRGRFPPCDRRLTGPGRHLQPPR